MAGRPKKYTNGEKDVHIRLDINIYDTITQMAKDEGCSRTDILRYLIYRALS